MMIEQPLDYDDIADHAALQRQLTTAICLDESIHSVRSGRDALDAKRVPHHQHQTGTRGRSRRVDSAPRPVCRETACRSGTAACSSPVSAARTISTCPRLPNFSLPGDVAASRRYYQPDLIEPGIEVRPDGMIPVPDGPGHRRSRGRGSTRDAPRFGARSSCCERLVGPEVGLRSGRCLWVGGGWARWPRSSRRPPVAPPTYEQKLAWMLRLEDQRILRDPPPIAPATPPAPQARHARPRRRRRPPPPVVSSAGSRAVARRSRGSRASSRRAGHRPRRSRRRHRSVDQDALGRWRARSQADGGFCARPARAALGRRAASDGPERCRHPSCRAGRPRRWV